MRSHAEVVLALTVFGDLRDFVAHRRRSWQSYLRLGPPNQPRPVPRSYCLFILPLVSRLQPNLVAGGTIAEAARLSMLNAMSASHHCVRSDQLAKTAREATRLAVVVRKRGSNEDIYRRLRAIPYCSASGGAGRAARGGYSYASDCRPT